MFADKTDVVVVYDVSNYVTTNKQITSGADDCCESVGAVVVGSWCEGIMSWWEEERECQ